MWKKEAASYLIASMRNLADISELKVLPNERNDQ